MIKDFNADSFRLFDDQWALVTAGQKDRYNTMTVSWGSLGTLWGKPVATVYVKPVRYTWNFLNDYRYFTISFFDEKYRKDLLTLGSKSGLHGDKVALTDLHPFECRESMAFQEANTILYCKKIFSQDLDKSRMPEDVIKQYYSKEAPHRMFIGEVEEVFRY